MQTGNIVFKPVGSLPDEALAYAVIMAQHEEQWLYVRHRQRTTWEIPGGHREPGESALNAACRELQEETGALRFSVTPVSIYGVERDGRITYGLLCKADVAQLGPLDPQMEISEIMHHPSLPEHLTYPAIQPALYAHVLHWLNANV